MIVYYTSELYHHGVKGMKWGIKNGPPYPIVNKRAKHSYLTIKSRKSNNKTYGDLDFKDPKAVKAFLDSKKTNDKLTNYVYNNSVKSLDSCGSDSLALELNRHENFKNFDGNGHKMDDSDYRKIFKGSLMIPVNDTSNSTAKEKYDRFVKEISEEGNNSSGIVAVSLKNQEEGKNKGHFFNWNVDSTGKVTFYDAKYCTEWDLESFDNMFDMTSLSYARLDDAEINEEEANKHKKRIDK